MNEDFSEQTPIAAPAPSYSSEEYKSALKLLEIGDLYELQKCVNLLDTASSEMAKETGAFLIFRGPKYVKALKHKLNQLCLKALEEEVKEKEEEFSVILDVYSQLKVNRDYERAIRHHTKGLRLLETAYQKHRVKYAADGSYIVQEVKIDKLINTVTDTKGYAQIALVDLRRARDRKAAELKLEEENNDKET